MQVAGVQLRVNHPVMVVGASEWVPVSLAIGEQAAVGGENHVVLRVRAHDGLVRVRFFSEADSADALDPTWSVVFDGVLSLPKGRLVVADGIGDGRFETYLGRPGTWRVRVAVDDAVESAQAVDIAVCRG